MEFPREARRARAKTEVNDLEPGSGASLPIADYALLSNCNGSALVSRGGSIDWACLPRFDSPSIFCRLLDPAGGHWTIAPADVSTSTRQYISETMVLRTEFAASGGAVVLTDALVLGPGEGHAIGRSVPHVLVRVIAGIAGNVEIAMEFAPRCEYGLTTPRLETTPGGLRSVGGENVLALDCTVPLAIERGAASSRFTIHEGERRCFALRLCSPWDPHPHPLHDEDVAGLLAATIASWRSWSDVHQGYSGAYQDLVRFSGRVLQALTYAPSGAIVAAPTTSLPEAIGGGRNWDYRFCWVRDASLTLEALWVAACPDEAAEFFRFFATAAGGVVGPSHPLQTMYGVRGERMLFEHELAHLRGYAGSRPVRVGNAAWQQTQLDVYGELLSAAHLLASRVGEFDAITSAFLVEVADTAASRWNERDHGIWEIRDTPRHMLHSKLLSWVAMDSAIKLAGAIGAPSKVAAWTATRDEIRRAIETHGWNAEMGAFTQAFGSSALDASALMIPLCGFLDPRDERVRSTIAAITDRLTDERGFVYRYRRDDGQSSQEGTFMICTFWLVECLAQSGDVAAARRLFERAVAYRNDVDLLSEELSSDGRLLGNFPQAFTHVGLVNAAWAITQAENQ
jgi:GH15 family glucan-1,4-alpha-glucosidase